MKSFGVWVAAALIIYGCGDAKEEQQVDVADHVPVVAEEATVTRALFTSELDENSDPTDELEEISVDEPTVHLFVKWDNLTPNREYEIAYTVVDGGGNLLGRARHFITPTGSDWATWYPYEFKKTGKGRRTGKWTFFIELDGVEKSRMQLKVVSEE